MGIVWNLSFENLRVGMIERWEGLPLLCCVLKGEIEPFSILVRLAHRKGGVGCSSTCPVKSGAQNSTAYLDTEKTARVISTLYRNYHEPEIFTLEI